MIEMWNGEALEARLIVRPSVKPDVPMLMNTGHVEVFGQFAHEKNDRKTLIFESDTHIPRSFTVLIAMGVVVDENGRLDFTKNGIAVIDNDNWSVVMAGYKEQTTGISGPSRLQKEALEFLADLTWPQFRTFCNTAAQTVARLPSDMVNGGRVPSGGSLRNQIALGLFPDGLDMDFRKPHIRKIHSDGGYNLPMATYSGMLNDLMRRPVREHAGRKFLSWFVGVPDKIDTSGMAIRGLGQRSSFNSRWKKRVARDSGILEEAKRLALQPYLARSCDILEMNVSCRFQLGGADSNLLLLKRFGDRDLGFQTYSQFHSILRSLSGEDLHDLWVSAHVLSQDMTSSNRATLYSGSLSRIRAEIEQEHSGSDDIEELKF